MIPAHVPGRPTPARSSGDGKACFADLERVGPPGDFVLFKAGRDRPKDSVFNNRL